MLKKPQLRWIGFFVLLFVVASGVAWWLQSNFRQGRYKDIWTAIYVIGAVKLHYYQPVSLIQLTETYLKKGNISDTLETLGDPYTRFLGKEEYTELQKDTKGFFGGIGIYLIAQEEELLISSVVPGSPSERAGLQQGDRIIAVDNDSVKKLGTDVAIARIRGEVGTKVALRIVRGEGMNRQEIDVTVTRDNIRISTVELKLKDDPILGKYAHLKISQFAETTAKDLAEKVKEISQSSAKGVILDLRSNPGGALNAAVQVAGTFLPDGTPILHVLRKGHVQRSLIAPSGFRFTEMPMVVLVDSWSASASEIVAGALKDQKRAYLIGTHTFGKDLIQEVKELPGGTGVTITIASYLTSGRVNIHKKGVLPHRVVEIPGAMDQLLKKGDPQPFFKMQELQEKEAIKWLREAVVKNLKMAG
ncbi:MAG TPA: S41 family peptidase [Bacillota bacterium]|nr:S41 family peptidase [Bacillota bacterium]